jgi:hypothetical protein
MNGERACSPLVMMIVRSGDSRSGWAAITAVRAVRAIRAIGELDARWEAGYRCLTRDVIVATPGSLSGIRRAWMRRSRRGRRRDAGGLESPANVGYGVRMQSRRSAFIVIVASLLAVDPRLVHAGGA